MIYKNLLKKFMEIGIMPGQVPRKIAVVTGQSALLCNDILEGCCNFTKNEMLMIDSSYFGGRSDLGKLFKKE